MTQPIILFSPRVSAISAQGCVLEVLVRAQAPDQPDQNRAKLAPKRLSLVVDRIQFDPFNQHAHVNGYALRCHAE